MNHKKHTFLVRVCLIAALTLLSLDNKAQQTARTTTNGTGYLEYLPPDYATNTNRKCPLLIFLHGSGETGSGSAVDSEKVKANGPPKLIQQGSTMCFGKNCFISNTIVTIARVTKYTATDTLSATFSGNQRKNYLVKTKPYNAILLHSQKCIGNQKTVQTTLETFN